MYFLGEEIIAKEIPAEQIISELKQEQPMEVSYKLSLLHLPGSSNRHVARLG